MVKTLLALFLGMLLCSCKKSDNNPPPRQPETKKYDVTFTTGFAATVTNFSVGHKVINGINQPVAGNVDNLYYRVYNSAGKLISSIDQASTVAGFGTISDQLSSGTYNVFIGGSKGALSMYTAQSVNLSDAYFMPSGSVWNDTFFKQFSLTVGANAVSQSVALDRLVGALDLTLTDAIPGNAKKITIISSSYVDQANLYGGYANWVQKSMDYPLSDADTGVKNRTFSLFASTSDPVTPYYTNITIRAYDISNAVIAEKAITGVPIYRNRRTALTGALFTSTNQNASFNITVNADWLTSPSPIIF